MKRMIIALVLAIPCLAAAEATTLCEVKVCNKLERVTFNLNNMIGDAMGEQCFNITLPKRDAIEGKVLSSNDKSWSVGNGGLSFNPTRKSVTRIKKVIGCRTL